MFVDKHRCQLWHYDCSGLAGIYVYLLEHSFTVDGQMDAPSCHMPLPLYSFALNFFGSWPISESQLGYK